MLQKKINFNNFIGELGGLKVEYIHCVISRCAVYTRFLVVRSESTLFCLNIKKLIWQAFEGLPSKQGVDINLLLIERQVVLASFVNIGKDESNIYVAKGNQF